MTIDLPIFPQHTPLSLNHQKLINQFNEQRGYNQSAANFTNLFIMDLDNQTLLSQLNGNIIVIQNSLEAPNSSYLIIGTHQIEATVQTLMQTNTATIEDLPTPILSAQPDRDNADYLYDVHATIGRSGSQYTRLRRKVNQFRSQYGHPSLVTLSSGHDQEVWKLHQQWLEQTSINLSTQNEQLALEKALQFHTQLGIQFDGIYLSNQLRAFALTEIVSQQTLLIHFFKTDREVVGLSEYLFVQLAEKYQNRAKLINFEQDLGEPGLRRFKQSLQPIQIIITYTIPLNLSQQQATVTV